MFGSAFPETPCSTMARSPSGRTIKCRHAVTFPNAAAASSSMPMTKRIAAISSRGSRRRLRNTASTTEIRAPHLSPPRTRRRAALRALGIGQGAVVGFNAEKSHRVVDMRECHILRPELFALVQPLRELLANLLQPRRSAEVQLTLVDQGADLLLKGVAAEGLAKSRADGVRGRAPARAPEHRPGAWARNLVRTGTGDRDLVRHTGQLSGRRLPSGDRRRRDSASRRGRRSNRGAHVPLTCSQGWGPSRSRSERLMPPRLRAMRPRRSNAPRRE